MTTFNFMRDPLHPLLEKTLAWRFPAAWLPVAIAAAIVLLAIAAGSCIEAYRQNVAETLLRRAEIRFENSRRSLAEQRLQWNELDRSIAQDRRLRQLRLSGSVAASKITALGNALPDDAWLTSMAAVGGGVDLKGTADGLDALQSALESVRHVSNLGQPQRLRFSADRHMIGRVAFEFHVAATR